MNSKGTFSRLTKVVAVAGASLMLAALPAWAQVSGNDCHNVGGVLMTNVDAIPLGGSLGTDMGPVFGDLAGSVAATILGENRDGSFNVQHYWVTSAGDKINFQQAVLHPTYPVTGDSDIIAVPWGNYQGTIIPGGTGRFENATGSLNYFGMADLHSQGLGAYTLVLRYSGQVCYNDQQN
jgi:hypothetical protein